MWDMTTSVMFLELVAQCLDLPVDALLPAERDAEFIRQLTVDGARILACRRNQTGVYQDQAARMLDEKAWAGDHDGPALADGEIAPGLRQKAAFERPKPFCCPGPDCHHFAPLCASTAHQHVVV